MGTMRNRHLGRKRRGSTILIVLALLSILVLLATTLAFTSRIDVLSSNNFARSVQNRTAAVTGLDQAMEAAFYALPQDAIGRGHLAFENQDGTTDQAALRTGTAFAEMADAAARINLNTANADVLEALITEVARAHGAEVPDAGVLADRIVEWRLGPDGAPGIRNRDDNNSARFALDATDQRVKDAGSKNANGELDRNPGAADRNRATKGNAREAKVRALRTGVDAPDEYIADVRYPAFGDDRRFQAASDLLEIDGFTPQLVGAIEPYLTVFSLSVQQVRSAGRLRPALDVNRATAEEIHEGLLGIYGTEKDDDLLRQFAVNIVDARDGDRRPTVLDNAAGDNVIIGFERTPRISEVYSDSLTDDRDGDDGQYIEIYNPWPESFNLQGWRVSVGGQRHALRGMLPSRGFLILTDDYDNSSDPEADDELGGQGSFYDVFGMVENGSTKRVIELPTLEVPHSPGKHRVELLDETGELVDRFDYAVTGEWSQRMSFQRPNVLVRDVAPAQATPFLVTGETAPAGIADRVRRSPQDSPFLSPVELFDVFAGYKGSTQSRWAFPVPVSPASTSDTGLALAASPDLIDARIIDLFVVESSERRDAATIARERKNSRGSETYPRALNPYEGETKFSSARDLEAAMWDRFAERPLGLRHGLVNVNTAPKTVLLSLGFTPEQAESMLTRRREREHLAASGRGSGVLYERLSDILVDDSVWGSATGRTERLAAFTGIYDTIGVGSRAFLIEGRAAESLVSDGPKRAGTRARAVVAMDKERPEIVSWRFLY